MSICCRRATPHVVTIEVYASFDDTAHSFWINPVLLCQYALRKRVLDIVFEYRNYRLIYDRPMIQGLGDEVNRRSVKAHTGLERAPMR